MFGGTVFGILIVYTPFTNGKLNLILKIAIFQTSMFLNPTYILIPVSFGILLLIVSTLDFYIRMISMFLIHLCIEMTRNEIIDNDQIHLTEIVKD